MYLSIHLIIGDGDEVLTALGDRGAGVAPMVQVYNPDMVGGPVSITFGSSSDDPASGIVAADNLIREAIRVRTELQERLNAGYGKRPLRPTVVPEPVVLVADQERPLITVPHPGDLANINGPGLPVHAAAGDPDGEGPDFPATDE